jgi:L-lactate dehydrogenase complex protein LldG
MINNQIAFLDRIRTAVEDTRAERLPWEAFFSTAAPTAQAARVGRNRQQQMILVQQLLNNAAPLNLQVHLCPTLAAAADCLATIVHASEPEFHPEKALILHDHPLLHALFKDPLLTDDRLPRHWTTGSDPLVRQHTLTASIGITVADWAIAESATIVQVTRIGRPRSTSLVPSTHIAVLPLANLVANLAEAYALIRGEQDLDSLVLISGPSKTADIEACMVFGAHGPRAMHLVVLIESPAVADPVFLLPSHTIPAMDQE